MLLDTDKLADIRAEFLKRSNGLDLEEFVRTLESFLSLARTEKRAIIASLIELFAQIDVNGDGSMMWDEFYAFILEQGLSRADANAVRVEHSSCPVVDDRRFSKSIQRIIPLADTPYIALIESNCSTVRIAHVETHAFVATLEHEAAVVTALFVPERKMFLVSACDHIISVWDTISAHDPTSFFRSAHLVPSSPQTTLFWDRSECLLYTGGVDGVVSIYSPEDWSYPVRRITGHKSTVKAIVDAPLLSGIFTASLDSSVRMWDKRSGKIKKKFKGHTKVC